MTIKIRDRDHTTFLQKQKLKFGSTFNSIANKTFIK